MSASDPDRTLTGRGSRKFREGRWPALWGSSKWFCSELDLIAGDRQPNHGHSELMWCILWSTAFASVAPTAADRPARATVQIKRAIIVSEQEWKSNAHRKERILVDEQGKKRRLRLIEFE